MIDECRFLGKDGGVHGFSRFVRIPAQPNRWLPCSDERIDHPCKEAKNTFRETCETSGRRMDVRV